MKATVITDREQLPLFLISKEMGVLLRIDVRTLGDFLEENPSCPAFRVGKRGQYRAPRDAFLSWLDWFATQNRSQTA